MNRNLFTGITLLLVCHCGRAAANTYYVSTAGSDSNSGSQAAPWRTIGQAAAAMVAGDTAIVMDGTYEEDQIYFANNGTQSAPITIQAQNKHTAVLSSLSAHACNPAFSIDKSWITLQDLRISVSPNSGTCGVMSSANGAVRCWSTNTPSSSNPTTGTAGCTMRGLLVDPSSLRTVGMKTNQDYSLFENNEVHSSLEGFNNIGTIFRNNVVYGGDAWGDSIYGKGGMRSFQIYGNILHKTSDGRGIFIGGSSGCCWYDGSTHYEAYNSVAYNNVIINEGGTTVALLGLDGTSNSALFNNVVIGGPIFMSAGSQPGFDPRPINANPVIEDNIIDCSGGALTTASTGWDGYYSNLLFDYNDTYNCSSGVPAQAHGLAANPLFVNSASDWHLQSGSPAIGAGTALAFTGFLGESIDVSKDFAGVARTAPWDLGVYATNGAPPPPPPPPSQNPLAYFKFDETSGTSAVDSSGGGNTLTLTAGAAFAPGKIGNALSLDGISGQAGAGSSTGLNFSQALTIAAWIDPVSSTATYRTIFVKADGTNYTRGYAFNIWNNYLNLAKVGAVNVPSTIALTTGAWQHVAVTFDASTGLVKFYLNGALTQTITNATAIAPPLDSDPIAVGAWVAGASYFPGLIDELKAYNRALSDSEIATLTAIPDTTPPTVSITAPTNGTTVSGTVAISATASDNVGVAGVQFKLDGANLGAEITISPFSASFDSTKYANGSHALTATARDAAGNTATSSPVTVNVNNAAPPKLAVALKVACAPNCPLNGTTTAVTVAVTSGTAVSMDFSRDGLPVFLTCPGGSQCYAAPIWGFDWCISSSCWGGIGGQHILNVTAHDASGQTATASVTINVSDTPPPLVTDLNGDGVTNVLDVQLAVNQALGVTACTNGDVNHDGVCNVQDVQLVVNKALGL